MKYTFGVMSSKWELEADDKSTAYVVMALHLRQNIPIAVYTPEKDSFMPQKILEDNKDNFDAEKVKECMATVKEVEL